MTQPKFSILIRKSLLFIVSIFFLSLCGVQEVMAVRPISANIALAAGQDGYVGFQDGSFTSALFNAPLGLAVSDDGTRLFVADSGNNRIRIIHLDQNNDVTTLAGQDLAGKLDGSLILAQFNNPHGVLYLPGDRLVVNDFGNQLLRLVDMKAGTVTTLTGGSGAAGAVTQSGSATLSTSPVAQVLMNGVRDMAYMPEANSIFFTQPDSGTLKMLNLKSGIVSTVLDHNAQLPNPAALWCQDEKLYVADRDLPQIYELDWKENTALNPVLVATTQGKVLSLSWNGDILYALLGIPGVPAERFIPNQSDNGLVSLRSPWGDMIPQESLFPVQAMSYAPSIGFVPDPSDKRKFYVAKPDYNMIVSFRDLFGSAYSGVEERNSNNVNEPEYPAQKPKNTYRILLVGDSRTALMVGYPFQTDFHQPTTSPFPRILNISKQIERELNFQAALDNISFNYEVLNVANNGYDPLVLWPAYDVPDIVKRNDVDLVLLFMPPYPQAMSQYLPYKFYFDHPISSEGIPILNGSKYLSTPPLERISKGTPRSFYDFCKAHNLVSIDGNVFNFDDKLFSYPELHASLVELYGKPLDILNQKVSGMKTSSGQAVRFLLCTTFTGRFSDSKEDSQIWVDAAKKYNFPILNLYAESKALRLSFFPLTGQDSNHLNPDGHVFFGRLLANALIRDKLIPWK
jgi:DNA-binding beta-propeller fold protein YncE